ncbi:hypothetical protein [Cellulomonas sp. JZ18]|uniref:hypothetical protein n=1 Tax=Cellulomonas sp. JZ18 TaxID=2654191 RepID=UPI0018AFE2CE|nr:hypothetical protein [Cellulomonas sp. JZ18]
MSDDDVRAGGPRLRATSITISTARPHEQAHVPARLLGGRVTVEDLPEPGDPGRPSSTSWPGSPACA